MFRQKFPVFLGKNIIRHGGDVHRCAQPFAQLQHQRRLAAADRAADANREGALIEVAIQRQFALVKMAGRIRVIVRVAVAAMRMEMEQQICFHKIINFGTSANTAGPARLARDPATAKFAPDRQA